MYPLRGLLIFIMPLVIGYFLIRDMYRARRSHAKISTERIQNDIGLIIICIIGIALMVFIAYGIGHSKYYESHRRTCGSYTEKLFLGIFPYCSQSE